MKSILTVVVSITLLLSAPLGRAKTVRFLGSSSPVALEWLEVDLRLPAVQVIGVDVELRLPSRKMRLVTEPRVVATGPKHTPSRAKLSLLVAQLLAKRLGEPLETETGSPLVNDFGGAGTGGKWKPTVIAPSVAVTAVVTPICNGIDDGPAWQSVLDQLGAQGGGTLETTSPCRIATPVFKNYHNLASLITIRGHGTASVVTLSTGGQTDGISIHHLDQLLFEDLAFAGVKGGPSDVRNGLNLSMVSSVVMRRLHFYGIHTGDVERSGIIKIDSAAAWTDFLMEDSGFHGSFGSSDTQTSAVSLSNYRTAIFRRNNFIDFGVLNGINQQKNIAPNYAWIATYEPRADTGPEPGNALSESGVFIDHCVFDEGTISAYINNPPPGKKTRTVEVTDSTFNGGIGAPLYVARVKNFRAKNLWFGYRSHVPAVPAILISEVDNAEIVNSDYAPLTTADSIDADASVKFLNVVNSNLIVNSEAQMTCTTVPGKSLRCRGVRAWAKPTTETF